MQTPSPYAVPPVHITNADQLLPLLWVSGGMAVGVFVYAIILQPLRRASTQHGWGALAAITSIIGGVIILWGALAGLYLSLDHVSMAPRSETFVERTISALFVFSLAWIAARVAAAWIRSAGRRSDHRLFSVSLYATIAQIIILVVGALTVLSSLGIAITPILTTLGLGGLAVALALNDTLSNLFAGVQIVAARQILIGNYVKFDFAEGTVVDIHWHNTTIRDLHNNLVVIPNAKVNTTPFTNFSMNLSDPMVPVPANLPWKGPTGPLEELAMDAANEAVKAIAGQDERSRCQVMLSAINETNVQVTAYLYADNIENRQRVVSEYLGRLYDSAIRANMGQQTQSHAAS